jgi:hypothetical protein
MLVLHCFNGYVQVSAAVVLDAMAAYVAAADAVAAQHVGFKTCQCCTVLLAVVLDAMAAYAAAAMVVHPATIQTVCNCCVCFTMVVFACPLLVGRCLLLWCLMPWPPIWQQQMLLQRSMRASDDAIASLLVLHCFNGCVQVPAAVVLDAMAAYVAAADAVAAQHVRFKTCQCCTALLAGVQVPAAVMLDAMAAYAAAAMVVHAATTETLYNCCACFPMVVFACPLLVCRCLLLWCLMPWLLTWQQQMPLQHSMWARKYGVLHCFNGCVGCLLLLSLMRWLHTWQQQWCGASPTTKHV